MKVSSNKKRAISSPSLSVENYNRQMKKLHKREKSHQNLGGNNN
jgi:hypothetical protein